ncbi:hypothetical protein MHM95_14965 [Pseudoalteromonas sp. CnMc7-15]|uniref:hypothetical protein n=1 Tax=unclassified Pseudoalteromonas TaxID=194690 RepID=UPI001EF5DFD4|nr:hypothetical protein [Pseudoalteromonas sp. CnMc7-15]MCG7567581.1 hypothetical protein [Pseudoalteromonas sp. CnMc7-15]
MPVIKKFAADYFSWGISTPINLLLTVALFTWLSTTSLAILVIPSLPPKRSKSDMVTKLCLTHSMKVATVHDYPPKSLGVDAEHCHWL